MIGICSKSKQTYHTNTGILDLCAYHRSTNKKEFKGSELEFFIKRGMFCKLALDHINLRLAE